MNTLKTLFITSIFALASASIANAQNIYSPQSNLLLANDGNYYGTTYFGGQYGDGAIFRMTPSGTVSVMHSFNGSDGSNPSGPLIQANDNYIYGTTGGSLGSQLGGPGEIFKMSTTGTFGILASGEDFTRGVIQASDGNFYGLEYLSSRFTIAKITSSGSVSTLYTLTSQDSGNPSGVIQGPDNYLYGLGTNDVFKISLAGAYTNVGAITNAGFSYGNVWSSPDGNLYAVGESAIYKITTGGVVTQIATLPVASYGGIAEDASGNLYTTTYPTAFQILKATKSGVVTSLHTFALSEGSVSRGALTVDSTGNIYGTASQGGAYLQAGSSTMPNGGGTLFKYSTGGTLSVLDSFGIPPSELSATSQTNPVVITQPLSLSVAVFDGSTPFTYQWQFNGANISGATNGTLTIPSVSSANLGSYSVLVSNAFGSATSNSVLIDQVSESAPVGQSITLSANPPASGGPFTYQWQFNATNIPGATNSTYNITNGTTSDSGTYTVTISNSGGTVATQTFVLTFIAPLLGSDAPTMPVWALALLGILLLLTVAKSDGRLIQKR